MLRFLQFCIIVAVLGSNGAYHWTPNPYVAGLCAVLLAFAVTVFISESLRLWRWLLKPLEHLSHKEVARNGVGGKPFTTD